MSALDARRLIGDETHGMSACPLVENVARLLRSRADEFTKQRVRTRGAALELGVCLRGDEPRVQVAAQLDHLDQLAIRARAGHDQAGRLQLLAVRAVELVTSNDDDGAPAPAPRRTPPQRACLRRARTGMRQGAWCHPSRSRPPAHRAGRSRRARTAGRTRTSSRPHSPARRAQTRTRRPASPGRYPDTAPGARARSGQRRSCRRRRACRSRPGRGCPMRRPAPARRCHRRAPRHRRARAPRACPGACPRGAAPR